MPSLRSPLRAALRQAVSLRSVKHEGVYLWAYENLHELEKALARWFDDYNRWKSHQALGGKTPWECYSHDAPQSWRLAA